MESIKRTYYFSTTISQLGYFVYIYGLRIKLIKPRHLSGSGSRRLGWVVRFLERLGLEHVGVWTSSLPARVYERYTKLLT